MICGRPNEYKAVVQPIEAHANILFSSGTTGQWYNTDYQGCNSAYVSDNG